MFIKLGRLEAHFTTTTRQAKRFGFTSSERGWKQGSYIRMGSLLAVVSVTN